jgi:hypothetical protein
MGWTIGGSIPGRGKKSLYYPYIHIASAHPATYPKDIEDLLPEKKTVGA